MTRVSANRREFGLEGTVIFRGATKRPAPPIGRRRYGATDVSARLTAELFRINLYAVVEALDVESSSRYQPGGGNTYCNVYPYDVIDAPGGYLPRVWWRDAALARIEGGAPAV